MSSNASPSLSVIDLGFSVYKRQERQDNLFTAIDYW